MTHTPVDNVYRRRSYPHLALPRSTDWTTELQESKKTPFLTRASSVVRTRVALSRISLSKFRRVRRYKDRDCLLERPGLQRRHSKDTTSGPLHFERGEED